MVKVMRHKAASPPYKDDSIVFARLLQCAPDLVRLNRHLHRTGTAVLPDELIDRPTCPSMSCAGPFSLSKLSLHVWGARGLNYHLIHGYLGPSESIRSVQPFFCMAHGRDLTDHDTPSVAIGRI